MELTPYQLRVLTHTVLGETDPGDTAGQAAVAAVILNRANSGQFPSDPAAVALQHSGDVHQFSAWNPHGRLQGNDNVRMSPNSAAYQAAEQVVSGVAGGSIPDPTGGATYYYAPDAMPHRGEVPSWAHGMYQTANIGGQLFFSPHPVPPADIPSNADPINGGVLQNPALMLPYPAPAPLTPPTGNVDPIGTGPGSFAALQAMLPQTAPPLPIPRPATPAPVAPVPMPTPNWLAPVAAPPAAAASNQHLVNLNGKMIAPGVYPSPSNPGSTVTVADDGTGKAVVTNNDPGFMNTAKMGSGTVAGGVIGKAISDAIPQVQQQAGQAAGNVGAAATQLGSNVAGFGSSLLSGLGGLFNRQPSTPSFLPSPVTPANSTGSKASGSDYFAPTPSAPAPAFTPSQMQVTNPAYTAYLAAQKADPISDPSLGDLPATNPFDNLGSSTAPAMVAPPKYITVPTPLPTPSWLEPPVPAPSLMDGLGTRFNASPIGHITQLLSGQPVQGGLLSLFNGKGGSSPGVISPPTSYAQSPAGSDPAVHAALLAQQTDGTQKDQNGNTVIAMNGNAARANPFINSFGMIT